MPIKTTFNLKFLAILCLLFGASCSYGQNNKTVKKSEAKATNQEAAAGNLLKKQILLTNDAQFTGDRTLEGASGFLIKYAGTTFAVTAKHLLGEAGGIEPEIKTADLSKSIKKWEMLPRVVTNAGKETVRLNADGLNFPQSLGDILLLKVASDKFDIEILTPNFELPAVGETLYLIGCPYSESKCKQNSYPVEFAEFDATENALVCEINSKVELSGFSGAPLVNGKGEVLGALVSGGAVGGKNYILATHIKEIQK